MRLAAHGIQLDLPDGWEGRVWRRPEARPVVHAANFPLPAEDGDFGTGAVVGMPATGVLVVLVEYDAQLAGTALFAATGAPPLLAAGEFSPRTLLRSLPGQAGLQRFFTSSGRPFCLYVVIGSAARGRQLAAAATRVVAGLRLE